MRKDGQPHVFKRVKLKDLYNQIKNGKMTERSFKEWLKLYSYKHWGRGWGDGFESQADYITQLEKGLESSIAMNKAQAERQEK